jgi:hypothetical protein
VTAVNKGNERATHLGPADAVKPAYCQAVTAGRSKVAQSLTKRFGINAYDTVKIDTS